MNVDVGAIIKRGDREYKVVARDDHHIKLQVLVPGGRLGRGRPASMTHDRFRTWLDPRAVSAFGGDMLFTLRGNDYHLISYNAMEERFTLRGMHPDGSYRRGRPLMMYLEDFAEIDQARILAKMDDM
jgi:hypothetical protein